MNKNKVQFQSGYSLPELFYDYIAMNMNIHVVKGFRFGEISRW